jgi:uncharacterized protein YyaL (SSP411 family)
VGFRGDLRRWDDEWYYVDAGIAASFFSRMAALTGDARWRRLLDCFIRDYLGRLYEGQGRFRKTWRRNGSRSETTFSRGYAWALDALLAAWEGLQDDRYLALASDVARLLSRYQTAEGCWNYNLERPRSGPCNKGTPIIAYHLARLAAATADDSQHDLAIRAERWCRRNVVWRPAERDHGGIVAWNSEGAIATQRSTPTAFSYASAYYVLLANSLGLLTAHERQ